jgi:hypothetical protein
MTYAGDDPRDASGDASGGSGGAFELVGLDPGLWRVSAWTRGGEVQSWTGSIERFGPGLHVVDPLLVPLEAVGRR